MTAEWETMIETPAGWQRMPTPARRFLPKRPRARFLSESCIVAPYIPEAR